MIIIVNEQTRTLVRSLRNSAMVTAVYTRETKKPDNAARDADLLEGMVRRTDMAFENQQLGNGGSFSTPELDYEGWRHAVGACCGWYSPDGIEREIFAGRVQARHICGFTAVDLCCNAQRVERTHRDIRLDGMDHYYAIFQIVGRSTVIQNDRAAELAVGDVALVDAGRPVTYVSQGTGGAQWVSLQLPRRSLVSYLGREPGHGSCRNGKTVGARLLRQLVMEGVEDGQSISNAYMRFAFYDLLGALFVPPDQPFVSYYAEKLFMRICAIIKGRFADPDFGPYEAAAEAGISLRYLQKLFTARKCTCGDFLHSVRLDHAARLLHRRQSLGTGQPLSEIAYACGFQDYTNFARKFRRRFGCSPSAHSGDNA
jgi:AraC family transcriptional activator of tynA and feaB